ncbi:MAG: S16 family serine protease, partial [Woeseiaceae bacterium]|nr:S16 family serine protease [Woeseiaceae bacterium]
KIIRKGIVKLLENPDKPVRVGVSDLEGYLGQPAFRKEKALKGVGVVTGLAWTAMGGATLSIEASRIHSNQRGFKLTGQLGDVMKESADIAYSYVSSNLKRLKGDPAFFDKSFVHLHVPEGATPKDGPSAGVTMATALLSIARKEAPAQNIAMTGELTLTGQVSVSAFGEAIDLAIVGASNVDEGHRKIVLMGVFGVITSIFAVGAWIVMVFYSLDALYAERKDKSILFWRSLPVTDSETVISKLLTAGIVIPLVTLVAVVVTQLAILVLTSLWVAIQGGDAGHLVWGPAPLADAWAANLVIALAMPLWLSPFIGWFLFVSAWTKRSPLLTGFLPILIVPMLERMLLGSHLFYDAIFVRTFRPPIANLDLIDAFEDHGRFPMVDDGISMLAGLDIARFVASPSLWAGLVVCGLFTTAAIYVRRYRDESY